MPHNTSYELSFIQQGTVLCVGTHGILSNALQSALDLIECYPDYEIVITEVTRKTLISSTAPNAVETLKSMLAQAPEAC